jgi:hypothetical protein
VLVKMKETAETYLGKQIKKVSRHPLTLPALLVASRFASAAPTWTTASFDP